jgi:hypothetical protein
MTSSILAPHGGRAQILGSLSGEAFAERQRSIESLPEQWLPALLAADGHKRPISFATGELLRDWPNAPAPIGGQLMECPAVALRTGSVSSTLCFDFDGRQSWKSFKWIFGDDPWKILPKSISWTSGREDRRQVGFNIDPAHHHLLKNKRRVVDGLEMRWEGAASIITGVHPETGSYQWVEYCAPWEVQLATLPLKIIKMIPDVNQPARNHVKTAPAQVYDFSVPLINFISYRTSHLIVNGSLEGNCNADAMAVSCDLVAAENFLKVQGVGVDRAAQDLYDEYVSNCPDRIHGKPLDLRKMQARFDGAVRMVPTPQTPENKLFERLDYHRRQAARNAMRAA